MKLKFAEWVEEFGGVNVLADALNIRPHTVRVWLRGDGAPEADRINTIIMKSKGKLSFQDIYKETTRSKK